VILLEKGGAHVDTVSQQRGADESGICQIRE
jgi:hypothetical protein